MINKNIKNKNLQQVEFYEKKLHPYRDSKNEKHELLIINKLKQLSHSCLQSETRIDNAFPFRLGKNGTQFSFENVNRENITTNNGIKKSSDFKWYSYFLYHNPLNLLFSIDQFLFEFAKKQPQRRKSGEFKQQLRERKKLALFYGYLSKKQLENLLSQSKSYQGYFSKNFFSLLERRLDVLLYRSGLAKNIITARQLISHKKIMVNNQILNIASYQVNPGDIITIKTNKKNQILSPLFETLRCIGQHSINNSGLILKKRPIHFTISPNFLNKLQNIKNSKNYKQKKTLKNSISLLLTKVEKRAHFKFKKSPFLYSCFLFSNTHNNIQGKKDTTPSLESQIFNKQKNFTLFKLKPLLSKQAKSFLLMCIQKNFLSLDRKPLLDNKYTRFINILEKTMSNKPRFFSSHRMNKEIGVKNQQLEREKNTNYSKRTPSNKKEFTALKSFTRKLSSSIYIKKTSSLKSSNIFIKKRTSAIYRNMIYKTLLHMYSYFFYSASFSFVNKQNRVKKGFSLFHNNGNTQTKKQHTLQKQITNTLCTLKLKKHVMKKRSRRHILKALRSSVVKPMHIEVSYSMSTAILLYSPQRLSFPFYIDVDLILRSFR
jgi:ribosomal protein S4